MDQYMSRSIARSKRSKEQCLKWAVCRTTTCHMHRGKSKAPMTVKAEMSSRKAVFRHGTYTRQSLALHKESMHLIRKSKNMLRCLE